MLRRQQASAIISAREKIVEGAVSMVKMALQKLSDEEVVELDDDKKARSKTPEMVEFSTRKIVAISFGVNV